MDSPQSPPTSVGEVDDSTPFKLFVGQVPTQMTAEQLRPTFEPFGNIEEVSIIHDKSTQMSKGCGFVTFSTEEAARAAIEALSEKLVLNGKPLVVKFAEGLRQRMEHKLHVANVPLDTPEEDLEKLFAEYGEVKQIQLLRRSQDDSFKGSLLVRYSRRTEATAAISALNGSSVLPGSQRPLAVKFAETRSSESSSTSPSGPSGPVVATSPPAASNGNFQAVVPMMYPNMPQGMQMGYGMGYGGHPAPPPAGVGYKLFVGMIPYSTGEAELTSVFSQFGPLMEVFMMREKDGRSKGCAFVRYYSKEAANQACLQLNGSLILPGAARNLVVKFAEPSEPRNRQGAPAAMAAVQHVGVRYGQGNTPHSGHGMPSHMAGGVAHAAAAAGGGFSPRSSMSLAEGGHWMAMQAATQGRAQMMAQQGGGLVSPQMVGMNGNMAVVPNMGMSHLGMSPIGSHYGGNSMEGMAMMHPGMTSYQPSYTQQPNGSNFMHNQYTGGSAYHQQQVIEQVQQSHSQGGGAWQSDGQGAGSYGLIEGSHGHADSAAEGGKVGAPGSYGCACGGMGGIGMMHNGMGACGGGMGSCGGNGGCAFGPSGGMAMLDRQMGLIGFSDAMVPAGQSWDRLYASNLPRPFTEAEVRQLFSQFGPLVDVHPHKRPDGSNKGSFFVNFVNAIDGQKAARALHNCMLNGAMKPMTVRPSTSRRKTDAHVRSANVAQHATPAAAAAGGGGSGNSSAGGAGSCNGNDTHCAVTGEMGTRISSGGTGENGCDSVCAADSSDNGGGGGSAESEEPSVAETPAGSPLDPHSGTPTVAAAT